MSRSLATGSVEPTIPDPVESAEEAGLRYVNDASRGITRKTKSGRSGGKTQDDFAYFSPEGKRITDKDVVHRIRSLAIPPAWTDVWICPSPNGHLQATGRDARGRKQHRYHPRWRQVRDRSKYDHVIDFAKALPQIRRTTSQHLMLPGLPRQKVLAAVVKLLEKTLIRVGNEEYARRNHSYGLTTLRDRHAEISGATVQFHFRGKSGVQRSVGIDDARLAKVVKNCQELPGYDLFQYEDDSGEVCDVKSEDVNDYLRELAGRDFTAKDFRTWAGTVLAAVALREVDSFDSAAQARKNIVQAVEAVSKKLGNTKAVCRKCYVHPAIFEAYQDGSLAQAMEKKLQQRRRRSAEHALDADETAVLRLLQSRLGGRAGMTTVAASSSSSARAGRRAHAA